MKDRRAEAAAGPVDHAEHVHHELHVGARRQTVSEDIIVVEVDDRGKVDLAPVETELGDVRSALHPYPQCTEVPLHAIGTFPVGFSVAGAVPSPSAAQHRMDASLLHKPQDLLVVDTLAVLVSQSRVDLPVSVSLLRPEPDCPDFLRYPDIVGRFWLLRRLPAVFVCGFA